jgi:hypothetical protein
MADTTITVPQETTKVAREKLAWAVLLISFAIFLFFAISIPLGIRWYIQQASVAQFAAAQSTGSVTPVLIQLPNASDPVALDVGRLKQDVVEGSVIRTDRTSQAQLDFFDRSTLTIFPNSEVTLSQMRRPRFGQSNQPSRIIVEVHSGRVRAQVSPSTRPEMHFELQTPQAPAPNGGIELQAGSYAIETSNEVTHVSVRLGAASVSGQTGQAIVLQPNERAEIPLGEAAAGPLPAKRNLLVNSDFQVPLVAAPISQGDLTAEWAVVSDQGGDGGTVDGTVDIVTTGASRAIRFVREGSSNNHGETGVVQQVNKHVDDYLSLNLSLYVEIANQSLSGGGEQSSEFPLIARVDYTDRSGGQRHWTQGFFCQNPAQFNIMNGTPIPCNAPVPYEVDLKEVLYQPLRIDSIKIYASGWDWDVYVSQVELIAE